MTSFDTAWGVMKYNPEGWGDVDPDFDRPFSEAEAPNLEVKPSQAGNMCVNCGEDSLFFIQCKLHPAAPYEWPECNFCSRCASEMLSMGGCSPCQEGEPPYGDE